MRNTDNERFKTQNQNKIVFLLYSRTQIQEHGIIMSISPNTLISKNQKNLIGRKS